jgi:pimeloyl-[acyl-carrier protein] synthase
VEAVLAAEEATASFALHLLPILGDRRHRPGEDLASQLLCLGDNGDALGLDEVLATCILLLTAGHETTANLIGNGVLTLMEHPGQLRLLQCDSALIKPAIEEILRFECPTKIVGRTNLIDRQLGEHRTPAPHLAFGVGPHFCFGAALSRAEAQETLRQLLPLLTKWRGECWQPECR